LIESIPGGYFHEYSASKNDVMAWIYGKMEKQKSHFPDLRFKVKQNDVYAQHRLMTA